MTQTDTTPLTTPFPFENPRLADAATVMRKAYELGWISTRDGNVSVAMSDRRGFLISASGVVKHSLAPSQFVFVPTDGSTESGGRRPSGELELHRRVQALVTSGPLTVLHLHPTHIVAALYAGHRLSTLSGGFPEVTRYTRVGADVPALPATSEELAIACEAAFRPALGPMPHVVGLDRHGVVAVGRSPWEAFEHVERLEHICRIVLTAGPIPVPTPEGERHDVA
ncbi:class II aldolase/adducin family protein [Zoogloea sp.]|uniref:class II aldolase/adducin family protein n=1 Tax=Zoogloea sp. TaxID=49181 RepID=UPI0035B1DAEA